MDCAEARPTRKQWQPGKCERQVRSRAVPDRTSTCLERRAARKRRREERPEPVAKPAALRKRSATALGGFAAFWLAETCRPRCMMRAIKPPPPEEQARYSVALQLGQPVTPGRRDQSKGRACSAANARTTQAGKGRAAGRRNAGPTPAASRCGPVLRGASLFPRRRAGGRSRVAGDRPGHPEHICGDRSSSASGRPSLRITSDM